MIWVILAVVVIAAAVVAYIVVQKRRNSYLAKTEYWVYSESDEMPPQDELMKRLVGANPYYQRGQNPIGPAEGILFSDIRLNIGLVLRSKNANLFDANLLPESIPDHHEFATDINRFHSIIRLQFVSPQKLKDKRHLQLLLHAADASAEFTDSSWIYDRVTGQLRTRAELQEILRTNFNVTRSQFHVRLEQTEDNTFRSFGLRKIGIDDFETYPVPTDQLSLVREVVEKYVELSWERGEAFPDPIKAYDDEFILMQKTSRPHFTDMRIVRKQMIS